MQTSFWHARWRDGQIGFHQDLVHPDLIKHRDCFLGSSVQRVLPLYPSKMLAQIGP